MNVFASPQSLFEYFAHLGMLTHTWALIETELDNISHVIFEKLGGNAIHRRRPRVLEQKLKCLHDWHEQLPALMPYRSQALALLERIEAFSSERHFYVHGFATAHAQSTMGFTIAKIAPDPVARRIDTKSSDLGQLLTLIHGANDLCTELATYSRELIMTFIPGDERNTHCDDNS